MSRAGASGWTGLLGRSAVVALTLAVVAAGVVVLVRNADGAYDGDYQVSGTFSAAGQGLHDGSEVDYDGVQVGQVTGIALVGGRARVTLRIEPTFRVPADTAATIRPQNLFGAEEVTLTSADGRAGPWLPPGGVLHRTAVSAELDDLFAAADPLLAGIDTTDLSAAVAELDQATDGEGAHIASGIGEGEQLTTLLANTLQAQLRALDSLTALSGVLAPTGPEFNAVSSGANAALPAINRAEDDFQALLDSLTPLADNIAQFLSVYRPDIATLLVSGDNVTRVLLAHQSDIAQLIHGTYTYLAKLGEAASAQTLPDGSRFAYFRTFIDFSDVNDLVCDLVAPAAPDLAALAPLQQALDSSGSPFDCSAEVSTFETIQQGTDAPATDAPATDTPAAPAPATPSTAAVGQGQQAADQLYQSLGTPQIPVTSSLGGYLDMLTGGR